MANPHDVPPTIELPVAVIQPLPGIGDMVWHVPHLRAIAAYVGEPVKLLTKPRSLADQLLGHEAAIGSIGWLDINPAGRRGVHDGIGGFHRLVRKLRGYDLGTVFVLHHSERLAAAAWMAGVPVRRGYGWGRQRWFLNEGPYLAPASRTLHQHTRATRYLEACGIPMASDEPRLMVPDKVRAEALTRLGERHEPFVAVGIGSSEKLRQWGPERFAWLLSVLVDAGWTKLVLVGGNEDMISANVILNLLGDRAAWVCSALGWNLVDVMGVLGQAAFYVGNNTGVMNIAAAMDVRTYGLFGTTPAFDHASQIVAVRSPDTGVHDGMRRLTVEAVVTAIHADRGRLGP